MTRRPEDDFTAFEIEERHGREQRSLAHPVFGGRLNPCVECGSWAHGDCGDWLTQRELKAMELRALQRRIGEPGE